MPAILLLLLTIIIWGFIFYLLWWLLGYMGLPEPFNKLGQLVIGIAVVVVIIGILMGSVAPFPILTSLGR